VSPNEKHYGVKRIQHPLLAASTVPAEAVRVLTFFKETAWELAGLFVYPDEKAMR
jgi:hypothetical protein